MNAPRLILVGVHGEERNPRKLSPQLGEKWALALEAHPRDSKPGGLTRNIPKRCFFDRAHKKCPRPRGERCAKGVLNLLNLPIRVVLSVAFAKDEAVAQRCRSTVVSDEVGIRISHRWQEKRDSRLQRQSRRHGFGSNGRAGEARERARLRSLSARPSSFQSPEKNG